MYIKHNKKGKLCNIPKLKKQFWRKSKTNNSFINASETLNGHSLTLDGPSMP